MKCDKCKKEFIECEVDEHHIHPRFMDNKEGKGLKSYLCKKCHSILHLIIPKIIWKQVPKEEKQKCIDKVIHFTNETYVGGLNAVQ